MFAIMSITSGGESTPEFRAIRSTSTKALERVEELAKQEAERSNREPISVRVDENGIHHTYAVPGRFYAEKGGENFRHYDPCWVIKDKEDHPLAWSEIFYMIPVVDHD